MSNQQNVPAKAAKSGGIGRIFKAGGTIIIILFVGYLIGKPERSAVQTEIEIQKLTQAATQLVNKANVQLGKLQQDKIHADSTTLVTSAKLIELEELKGNLKLANEYIQDHHIWPIPWEEVKSILSPAFLSPAFIHFASAETNGTGYECRSATDVFRVLAKGSLFNQYAINYGVEYGNNYANNVFNKLMQQGRIRSIPEGTAYLKDHPFVPPKPPTSPSLTPLPAPAAPVPAVSPSETTSTGKE